MAPSHPRAKSTSPSVLSLEQTAAAAKKRAKKERVQEVVFDEALTRRARIPASSVWTCHAYGCALGARDYLIGVHKRTLALKQSAKQRELEREKEVRRAALWKHCRALATRAAQNAYDVEAVYGAPFTPRSPSPNASDEPGSGEAGERKDGCEVPETLPIVAVTKARDAAALLYRPVDTNKRRKWLNRRGA